MPALCGVPTREDAEQVLDVSVARQHEFSSQLASLTQQRREVLSHPERLESLGLKPDLSYVELIPRPKNRSNNGKFHNQQKVNNSCVGQTWALRHTAPHVAVLISALR